MTREEAKEYASFLNAFAEGKEVQHAFKDKWVSFDEQDIYNIFHYLLPFLRIKPEPKYRPYTVKEMLYIITESRENRRGYPVFVDKSDNEQVFLIAVNNDSLVGKRFDNVYIFITFRDFLTDCQWTNGAICGIEVTE